MIGRISGHLQQVGEELYHDRTVISRLVSKIRPEIAVNDASADNTANTILMAARTIPSGEPGDGKLFYNSPGGMFPDQGRRKKSHRVINLRYCQDHFFMCAKQDIINICPIYPASQ